MSDRSGVEINVVDWDDGEGQEVAIQLKDLNQLMTISADGARQMAFMLMECADFIDPPFGEGSENTDDQDEEYESDEDEEC